MGCGLSGKRASQRHRGSGSSIEVPFGFALAGLSQAARRQKSCVPTFREFCWGCDASCSYCTGLR